MEPVKIEVLDRSHKLLGIIDEYISFNWSERFREAGVFVLKLHRSTYAQEMLQLERVLAHKNSLRMMVIEKITYEEFHMTVEGRSAESYFARRVVEQSFMPAYNQGAGGYLHGLIWRQTGTGTSEGRRVPISLGTQVVPSGLPVPYSADNTGKNLYELVVEMLKETDTGWSVISPNRDGNYRFDMYKGNDYSDSGGVGKRYIEFSQGFDNLMDSRYVESTSDSANVALVASSEDAGKRLYTTIYKDGKTAIPVTGFDRREIFVDASQVQRMKSATEKRSDAEMLPLLQAFGATTLGAKQAYGLFDGDVRTTENYVYGSDYSLGDLVQVVTPEGNRVKTRVVEYTWQVENGHTKQFPTLDAIPNVI